jgi:hypothetical protein
MWMSQPSSQVCMAGPSTPYENGAGRYRYPAGYGSGVRVKVSARRGPGCPRAGHAVELRAFRLICAESGGERNSLGDDRGPAHAGRGEARGTAGRAAGGRLLADPGRALRHDAAGRPGRRRHQGGGAGRGRHPHLAAAGAGRRLDLLPRHQPQQAVGGAGSAPGRGPGPGARARPAGRRVHPELPAWRPGPLRPGLRRGVGRQPYRDTTSSSRPSAA